MVTKILKIDDNSTKYEAEIRYSADVIAKGGLVVFPTETVYGLGADATNADAVKKIYIAKGRPSDNPLIIHIAQAYDAEKYAYTNDVFYRLADKFMPGPLTIVLNAKDSVPMTTRGGLNTVAIRCPENKIARALISASGVGIAAPSANLSGTPSPTSAEHVINDMNGRVDVIIDGGRCDFGLESTIVKIEKDGSLVLLRPGKITVEELLAVVNEVKLADSVTDKLKDGEVALSPGMKYRHYAPRASLVLVDADALDYMNFVRDNLKKDIGVISHTEFISDFSKFVDKERIFDFGSMESEIIQANRLFDILRETDKSDLSVIYAPLPKPVGIGLALYNRMIRAAAHKIVRLRR